MSRFLARALWFSWPRAAYAVYRKNEAAREDFLGTYAPFYLIFLLALWVTLLLCGWGLVFFGMRDQLRPAGLHFADTFYYAGSSLLTIGYGDIVAQTTLARVFSLMAAASGLAVVAVVISFLFAIFGAFQTREQFVVTLGARAGVPPSGVGLLEVLAHANLRTDLAAVLREGQSWAAVVMETHLAYPILIYFRSSHDYQSWVSTLGMLLDASALVISTLDPADMQDVQSKGQAHVMFELGRHLTHDFAQYFAFMERSPGLSPGVERQEFSAALERLRAAGYKLLDEQVAWSGFLALRSSYGAHLNALARWLEIPPVQWIGDRSLISPRPH